MKRMFFNILLTMGILAWSAQAIHGHTNDFIELGLKPALIAGLGIYGWNKMAPHRKQLIQRCIGVDKPAVVERCNTIVDRAVKVGLVVWPLVRAGIAIATAIVLSYRFNKTKDVNIGYWATASAINAMFQSMFAAVRTSGALMGGIIGQWASESEDKKDCGRKV